MQRVKELRYGIEKVGDQSTAATSRVPLAGWKEEVATKTSGLTVASNGMVLRKPTGKTFLVGQTTVARITSPIAFDVYMDLVAAGVGDLIKGEKKVYSGVDPNEKPIVEITPIPLPVELEGVTVQTQIRTTLPSGCLFKGGPSTFLRAVEFRGEGFKGGSAVASASLNVWEKVSGDWAMPADSGFVATSDGYGIRATQARDSVVIAATATTQNTGFGVNRAVRVAVNGTTLELTGNLGTNTTAVISTVVGVKDIKVGDIITLEFMKTASNSTIQTRVLPGTGTGQTRLHIY